MDADERDIYYFLKSWRHEYISGREICRRAGGKKRFREEAEWAKPALARMVERGILETDPAGYFRIKPRVEKKGGPMKRWISPEITRALQQSGKDFGTIVMSEQELDDYYDKL